MNKYLLRYDIVKHSVLKNESVRYSQCKFIDAPNVGGAIYNLGKLMESSPFPIIDKDSIKCFLVE